MMFRLKNTPAPSGEGNAPSLETSDLHLVSEAHPGQASWWRPSQDVGGPSQGHPRYSSSSCPFCLATSHASLRLGFPVGLAIQMKCSFKLPILSFNCLSTEWPDYGPLLSQTHGLICSTLSSLCEGRPTRILFSCYTPRTPHTPHPLACSLLPQPCPWNRGFRGQRWPPAGQLYFWPKGPPSSKVGLWYLWMRKGLLKPRSSSILI